MKVLFAGTPEVAVPTLEHLHASDYEIVGVVTRPDARSGRGKKLVASNVADAGQRLDLPVYKPVNADELAQTVAELAPDVAVVVAYGMLLPQALLDMVPHGWINLHFSLLPRWRGASPVQHAVRHGDQTTGATTFRIVRALDAGPIYRQISVEIDRPTTGELLNDLAIQGAGLVTDTLADVAAGIEPVPQGDSDGSYAGLITPADTRIDWTDEAISIDRLIRAASPAPMAWTTWNQERFRVIAAEPIAGEMAPGELHISKNEVQVGTGSGALRLLTVQPAGKRAMNAADWGRGLGAIERPAFDA